MLAREIKRKKRHWRIRKIIFGTEKRPRLSVYRSLKHLHVQLVDDESHKTLFAFSTKDKPFREKTPKGRTVSAASLLGEWVAKEAKAKGVIQIVFDRSGYLYHGRVKAVAEGCRKGGLQF